LPELPVQYADYAAWQREWLQGERLEAELGYWKAQLEGAPTVLDLPTDRPRPPHQTYRGSTLELSLSQDLTDALKSLGQVEECTLFMTLLAAFGVMLHRYTGQDDILVGSPIANRNRAEIEGLIGFFVNTLVLRTRMEDNPSFLDVLRQVRETTLGAYAHQDIPFEMLVDTLQPQRDMSRSPLFQVMFALQNAPQEPLMLPGLTFSPLEVDGRTAKFDLTLSLVEVGRGLEGIVEYNTDLFEAATISRLAGHLKMLLESVVSNPDQRIAEIALLPQVERHQLLVDWNTTGTVYPREACVHKLFEAQTKRTPDATALVFRDWYLTYGELNRRANQLAHHLQGLGVRPETPVCICVERSLEMVMGLLGILKAGGAYVPLDPAYPQERLAFMLEDTQSPVLLTQRALVEGLPKHDAHVICLDADWETIARQREENLDNGALVGNPAYAIYTSGSTGQPKGVLVEHNSLLNLTFWHQGAFAISHLDRATQVAGLAFDASVWELWPYLTLGASIHIPLEETRTAPEQLRDWLLIERISISFLPTPLAEAILSLDWPQRASLRTLLTGGERLYRYPNPALPFELVNNYGPTENTVVASSGLVRSGQQAEVTPAIGHPVANNQIYILDPYMHPVPLGVAGELCIGGDSLARGYLNRPELTAEAFIPNPFPSPGGDARRAREGGGRLYRTGDLARYRSDGNIEFLGRTDRQVKIRGFRIELGEIEAVLTQHPAVRETVALAREDTPGDKRVVAYVVASDGEEPSVQDLRGFLGERLPGYMIPAAFVMLEELPLTPNGKMDRRALPAPKGTRPGLEQTYVAPRTPGEEALAGIWGEVLGLEQVGVYDNFFELGGHSLLATQVISRVRYAFQVELPVRALFEAPTVAALGQVVLELQMEKVGEEAYQMLSMIEHLVDE
jgi:amino acid adenylation domain-containing protein